MKAVAQDRYGPPEVLRIAEIEKPVPKDDEILVRVRASTVSQTDTHIRRPDPIVWRLIFGFRKPRMPFLGVELAGEVEAVGAAVTEYKVGHAVFGHPSSFVSAHAEYVQLVRSKRLRMAAGRRSRADVLFVKELIEAGEFRAVVDRTHPMSEVVEAHRYVESWRKAGNVVLTIP
jgi:NADPH:quinone reductase-like Zn-dependent oxidoreductase